MSIDTSYSGAFTEVYASRFDAQSSARLTREQLEEARLQMQAREYQIEMPETITIDGADISTPYVEPYLVSPERVLDFIKSHSDIEVLEKISDTIKEKLDTLYDNYEAKQ
jgi:hypothetical protein